MKFLNNIFFPVLFIFQDAYEIDWEFEDEEIFEFFLVLLGILLIIIILAYILLTSKKE